MKKLLIAAVGLLSGSIFAADYYVNCNLDDYTGHDGSTPEKALETIQQAVAKPSGSVIHVAAGRYDKGIGRGFPVSTHWWKRSRVSITDKNLTFIGEGADKTFIVGAHDPETGCYGTNAVRCLDILDSGNNNQVIFKGFTFCDGATVDSTSLHPGSGGAVLASDGSTGIKTAYFVDCVVSNCTGVQSAIWGGVWIRAHITKNDFVHSSKGGVNGLYRARFINSLLDYNRYLKDTDFTTYTGAAGIDGCTLVNCTVAANGCLFKNYNSSVFRNTILSSCNISETTTSVTDDHDVFAMIAPRMGDIRVREGSAAYQTANKDYLSPDVIALPEELEAERCKDFYGRAIDTNSVFHMGAVQESAAQVAGAVRCSSTDTTFGDPKYSTFSAQDYAIPTVYPTNYCIRPILSSGGRVYGYSYWFYQGGSEVSGERAQHFPLMDDTCWVMPPPSTGSTLVVSTTMASKVIYADAETAEETATQDGTAEHPYKTLQQAVDSLDSNASVIVAKKGTYDAGNGTRTFSSPTETLKVRVDFGSKNIRLVSEEGADKTFIVGAPDPDTEDGNGAGATLLAANANGSNYDAVQGFTLTNGYSGTGYTQQSGKGSVYCYFKTLHFLDCTFAGNHGSKRAIGGGTFRRCVFTNNVCASGLFVSAALHECVVYGNNLGGSMIQNIETGGGTTWMNDLFDVSIVGDGEHNVLYGENANDRYYNLAIADGHGCTAAKGTYSGNIFGGFATAPWASGVTVGDPMFASTNDLRVFSKSPAVTTGRWDVGPWWYYAETDFTGKPWQLNADGTKTAGAYQETSGGGVYVAHDTGMKVVSGGAKGLNEIEVGQSVTVGLEGGSKVPIAGILVNGVTNYFNESYAGNPTLKVTRESADDYAVSLIYATDKTWYVDAVNGSDTDKFGYNPGYAFKTLAKALTGRTSGDTVIALPGTYDEGTMEVESNAQLKHRAVIPAGVTLASRDGAVTTFIKGQKSDIAPDPCEITIQDAFKGLGPNAIAGVNLKDNAVIRGFTITNGYTRGVMQDGKVSHGGYVTVGGGVSGNGSVYDCVVTGCAAYRGGAGYRSYYYRCIFDGNKSIYGGGGTSDAWHYGCLTRNNYSQASAGYAGIFYWNEVENCTILDGIGGPNGSLGTLKNTLVWGNVGSCDFQNDDTKMTSEKYKYCVFADRDSVSLIRTKIYRDKMAAGEGCIITNLAAIAVDDDGRPVVGSNVAIDAGNLAIFNSKLPTDYDLSGVQRVYNGTVDIGALEADWRETYATALGKRATVTEASSGVTMASATDKKVTLHDGNTLKVDLAKKAPSGEFTVAMNDGGELTVMLNGEEFKKISASGTYSFKGLEDTDKLEFAYAGDGTADISAVRSLAGLCVIFW